MKLLELISTGSTKEIKPSQKSVAPNGPGYYVVTTSSKSLESGPHEKLSQVFSMKKGNQEIWWYTGKNWYALAPRDEPSYPDKEEP